MGRSDKEKAPKELPLFDGGEADTVRATAADLSDSDTATRGKEDIARIDTDRQKLPSSVLPAPLGAPPSTGLPTPQAMSIPTPPRPLDIPSGAMALPSGIM